MSGKSAVEQETRFMTGYGDFVGVDGDGMIYVGMGRRCLMLLA